MTFEAQLCSAVASGDEDLRHDFESEHGVWFGFRSQPGAVAEEIADAACFTGQRAAEWRAPTAICYANG